MALEKTISKLDKYLARLSKGQASKIKPADLEKVETKLRAKKAALLAEMAETQKPSKKERFKAKISVVDEQLERAQWLATKLSETTET